jgi:glucose/arabinose dehydrogenase
MPVKCIALVVGLSLSFALHAQSVKLKVDTLNSQLTRPFGLAFLPDGRMLVTEKAGVLKLLSPSGATLSSITAGLPPMVHSDREGGLLDVVVDPAFASNQRIYFSFGEGSGGLSGTSVARARLDLASGRLQGFKLLWQQSPKVAGSAHFGSRLVFDRTGNLFIAVGDREAYGDSSQRAFSQDLSHGHGKVVRITVDGAPANDNPSFRPSSTQAAAQRGLYSYGHRNVQGAALHPQTGDLWVSDHGPQGGDEINRVLPGRNYGWPVISHGQEYGSTAAAGEATARSGMEQPVSVWVTRDGSPLTGGPTARKSSMAPSGLAFYTGDGFPEFKGNLFSGALAGTALWRVVLGGPDGATEVQRERLLADLGERIRDVRQGPDGWLYLLTDNGKLLRVSRQ